MRVFQPSSYLQQHMKHETRSMIGAGHGVSQATTYETRPPDRAGQLASVETTSEERMWLMRFYRLNRGYAFSSIESRDGEACPCPWTVCEAMGIGGSIQPFRQKKQGRERGGEIGVRPGGSVRLPSARPLRHAHRVLLDAQVESFFCPCAHPARLMFPF